MCSILASSPWTFNTQTASIPYQTLETIDNAIETRGWIPQERGKTARLSQTIWLLVMETGGSSQQFRGTRFCVTWLTCIRLAAWGVETHCVEEDNAEVPLNSQGSEPAAGWKSRKTKWHLSGLKLSKPPVDPRTSDAAFLIWTAMETPRAALYSLAWNSAQQPQRRTLEEKCTRRGKRTEK